VLLYRRCQRWAEGSQQGVKRHWCEVPAGGAELAGNAAASAWKDHLDAARWKHAARTLV